MKRLLVLSGCIAAAFLIVLEAAPQQVEVEEVPVTWKQVAVSDGEVLYAELCAVCHGADGKGDGPASPALAVAAPDLTGLAADNGGEFPTAEVRKAITGQTRIPAHGTVEMPMWGRVFEDLRPDVKPGRRYGMAQQRIYNLVAYLESLQGGDAGSRTR